MVVVVVDGVEVFSPITVVVVVVDSFNFISVSIFSISLRICSRLSSIIFRSDSSGRGMHWPSALSNSSP